MEESKKKKILLTILGILLLVILATIVYFLFFYNFTPQESQEKNNSEPKQEEQGDLKPSPTSSPDDSVEDGGTKKSTTTTSFQEKKDFTEMDLKKFSSSFVERFGSYSNHSSFSNLKDSKMFMTESMQDWAEDHIKEQTQKDYSGEYYGISTQVISAQIEDWNKSAGEATVLVQTRRTETKDEKKSFNQDIELTLIKSGGEWRVDYAKWQ